jgi:hypothetical protein
MRPPEQAEDAAGQPGHSVFVAVSVCTTVRPAIEMTLVV